MPKRRKLPVTQARSRLMARVRQSGTAAELRVRRIVHRCGFRFRTQANNLPGSPDLVNRLRKWAIFVHGCFWHAHDGCPRSTVPRNNRRFWRQKFKENRRRDARNVKRLEELNYRVLTVWECELEEPGRLEGKIRSFLGGRGSKKRISQKSRDAMSDRKSNESWDGSREQYRFARSRRSVTRAVYLSDGSMITKRINLCNISSPEEDARSAYGKAFLRKRSWPLQSGDLPIVRVVDLFCGCGGLSLGAWAACLGANRRFLVVAAVDSDPDAVNVYARNFRCADKAYQADVARLLDGAVGTRLTDNERRFIENLGPVDVLLAGPPCQGYSDLNNYTRRKDPRNALYERVARFVEISKPEHVLIENVPTAIHGREKAVQNSVSFMRDQGYEVDSGVVDLSLLGVPQRRKRHVVVASLSKKISLSEVTEKYRWPKVPSVRWAIEDLEAEPANDIFTSPSQHNDDNKRRMQYLFDNDVYDLPNRLRPPCHRDGHHSYKSMYGRLRYDEPAQTITSGFLSPGQGRFIHPTWQRTITPHEAARLQLFPDFFDFSAFERRTSLARMIGNAVPMKLSYAFCLEFLA